MTTLIISKDKINDIMKIIESHEDAGLFIKDVSVTVENEAKVQNSGFLSKILGTSEACLLRNLLTGKGVMRAGECTIRAGEGTIRAGQEFQCRLIKYKKININIKMRKEISTFGNIEVGKNNFYRSTSPNFKDM